MKELIEPYYLRLLPPDTTEDKLPETIIRQMANAQKGRTKPDTERAETGQAPVSAHFMPKRGGRREMDAAPASGSTKY